MRVLLIIFGILIASSTSFAHERRTIRCSTTKVVVVKKVKPVQRKVWVPGHWVKTRRGKVWVAGHWKRV